MQSKKLINEMNIDNSVILEILKTIIRYLEDPEFINKHKINKNDFSRKRIFDFKKLVLILINSMTSSSQKEIDNFFNLFNEVDQMTRVIGKSAFSKARNKLNYTAFNELIQLCNDLFYKKDNYKKWEGFRLLAIDGSKYNIVFNEKTAQYFGSTSTGEGYKEFINPIISIMYDVLNEIVIDIKTGNIHTGEREYALKQIESLSVNDLVLADRGYPAFYLFKKLESLNVNFCVRVKENEYRVVKKFIASGDNDQIAELDANKYSFKNNPDPTLPRDAIKVRLIKIPLKDGKIEVLCSSLLDQKEYPYECFRELYEYRWPVEEGFKVLKCRLQLENFISKSPLGILQEIYAKALISNIGRIISFPLNDLIAKKNETTKYNYKVNFSQVLGKMKNNFVKIMIDQAFPLIEKLLKLIMRDLECIRPNRTYQRKRYKKRYKYSMAYKTNT